MIEWFKLAFVFGSLVMVGAGFFLFGASSCAGRDVCGKWFCPVGILSDDMLVSIGMITIGVIGCIVSCVGYLLWIAGYCGAGI